MEIDELSIVVRGDISDVQEKLNKLGSMMKNLGNTVGGSGSSSPMSKVSQSITRDVKKITVDLEEYKNKVKDLSKNWEFNGSIESARLYLKNFERQLQTAKEKLEDLEVDGKSGNSAWQTYTKTVARLTNKISILQKKLEETSVSMQDISQIPIQMYEDTMPKGYWDDDFGKDMENRTTTLSGEYTQPDVSALKEEEKVVEEINNQIEIQYKKHSKIAEKIRDIRTEWQQLSDKITKVTAPFAKFATSMKSIKRHSVSLDKTFQKMFKSITRMYRMLRLMITRMILRGLISNAQEGFKNLVQYSDRANASFSLIWNSFKQSGNSLAAMVSPLLYTLAPTINNIIQLFIRATNAVNQFLAALTGQSTWTHAKELTDDYRESLNGAAKAAKTLTMGIDELNILNDNGGGGSGSSTDFKDMFEEKEIDSYFKRLSEKFKNVFAPLYEDIDKIKNRFKNIFEDIKIGDWFKLGNDVSGLAIDMFNFLTDALNMVDWHDVGNKIGAFLSGIDWKGVLTSAGNFVKKLWDSGVELWKGAFEAEPIITTIITGLIVGGVGLRIITAIGKAMKTASAVSPSLTLAGLNMAKMVGVGIIAYFSLNRFAKMMFPKDADFIDYVMKHPIESFKKAWEFFTTNDWQTIVEKLFNALQNWFKDHWSWETIFGISIDKEKLKRSGMIGTAFGGLFADGGFPEDGLFFANHNELVGGFTNGKTAVANNDQIVAGIQYGVRNAVAEVLSPYLSQIADNTRATANKDLTVNIGDRDIARANKRGQRSLGMTIITQS